MERQQGFVAVAQMLLFTLVIQILDGSPQNVEEHIVWSPAQM